MKHKFVVIDHVFFHDDLFFNHPDEYFFSMLGNKKFETTTNGLAKSESELKKRAAGNKSDLGKLSNSLFFLEKIMTWLIYWLGKNIDLVKILTW